MAKFGWKFEPEFLVKDNDGVILGCNPIFGSGTDAALQLGANDHTATDGAITFLSANTSGLRANADNTPKLIRKQFLPNGAQGQNPSGGWTCTGLFKLANGNWLVGNDGRVNEADTTFEPSIVELSFDGQTIVTEFDMSSIVGNNSVQGVIEANDGSYWIASPNNNSIHNINSTTGAEISTFAATGANGLAYDSINNNLLWCSAVSSTVHIYSIGTATELSTITTSSSPDQLCFNNGALFVTKGANGTEGDVYIYDVVNDKFIGRLEDLPACEAIEGIHVDDNSITLANDGGFHATAYPARNMLLTYKFNNVYPAKTKFIGIHGKLTLNGAAPANRETLVTQGQPVSGTTGWGWALYIMSSNELRIQMRDSITPASLYLAEYAITRGVEFTFDIYVDITGVAVYCEIDGVDQGVPDSTAGAIGDIVADINMTYTTIGVSQEANPNEYPINADIKNVFTTTTLADFNAVKVINQGDDNVVSDASITATGAPDAQYNTILFDEYGNEILNSNVEFTTNTATAYGCIAPPSAVTGYVIDNEATHVDGAVITGTTV